MTNGKDKEGTAPESDQHSKLDAIKEIIFGQQIREYETEFNEVRDAITRNRKEVDKNLDKTGNDILARIASMEKALLERIELNHQKVMKEVERLNDQKTDRKALGKMLATIGSKLSS